MACGATLSLKRSLEFDPLYSPGQHSPKRRRCVPMSMSVATPQPKILKQPSAFTDASPKLTSEQIAARIGAEIKRMHRRKQLQHHHSHRSTSSPSPPSTPPHVHASVSDHTEMQSVDAQPSCSPPGMSSSTQTFFAGPSSPSQRKDVPLFTFKHLNIICERLLKEREEHLKEEYDKVLTCKLAEQYEAFLKFNHDQLHRRFSESAASYVS